ncbi:MULTISPECIES: hypothetical protein [Chelatococcus]|nr:MULTISPECIES: hypothetical protein [Chelatococcus]
MNNRIAGMDAAAAKRLGNVVAEFSDHVRSGGGAPVLPSVVRQRVREARAGQNGPVSARRSATPDRNARQAETLLAPMRRAVARGRDALGYAGPVVAPALELAAASASHWATSAEGQVSLGRDFLSNELWRGSIRLPEAPQSEEAGASGRLGALAGRGTYAATTAGRAKLLFTLLGNTPLSSAAGYAYAVGWGVNALSGAAKACVDVSQDLSQRGLRGGLLLTRDAFALLSAGLNLAAAVESGYAQRAADAGDDAGAVGHARTSAFLWGGGSLSGIASGGAQLLADYIAPARPAPREAASAAPDVEAQRLLST